MTTKEAAQKAIDSIQEAINSEDEHEIEKSVWEAPSTFNAHRNNRDPDDPVCASKVAERLNFG